jgi:hypothetical protein
MNGFVVSRYGVSGTQSYLDDGVFNVSITVTMQLYV